jgi:hypothetical protein
VVDAHEEGRHGALAAQAVVEVFAVLFEVVIRVGDEVGGDDDIEAVGEFIAVFVAFHVDELYEDADSCDFYRIVLDEDDGFEGFNVFTIDGLVSDCDFLDVELQVFGV